MKGLTFEQQIYLNYELRHLQQQKGLGWGKMREIRNLYRKIKKFTHDRKASTAFVNDLMNAKNMRDINYWLHIWEKAYQEAKELRENFGAL